MPVPKVLKVPRSLGGCADRLMLLRDLKKTAAAAVARIAEEESLIKNHLIETLPKSDAIGVAGKIARVTITAKVQPTVKDWDKFFAYVHKKKAYDLLQRRVSGTAVQDRWDNGLELPGVEKFNVVGVSVVKV